MANKRYWLEMVGLIVLVTVIGFSTAALSLTGCNTDDGGDGGGGDPIPQTITYSGKTIDDTIYVLKITENTARYTAQVGDSYVLTVTTGGTTKTSSGTVTKKTGDELELTPSESTTTFTIIVSASGITAITGTITFTDGSPSQEAPTDITAVPTLPEYLSDADRWWKWDDVSTAKLTLSVAVDGVCTITVGGKADIHPENPAWNRWKAQAGYLYTEKVDTAYEYTFEAWTQSGSRTVEFCYYDDANGGATSLYEEITLTSTRTTYTVYGQPMPIVDNGSFSIKCADQLGTFYVKVLSITPYYTQVGTGMSLSDFEYYTDDNSKKDGKEDQIKWTLEDELLEFSLTAKYLVVNMGTAPSGVLTLFWQHSGDWNDWPYKGILNDDGSAISAISDITTLSNGSTMLKITLATGIDRYADFLASAQVDDVMNLGLGYWIGDTQIRALNIQWAYLLE